MDTLFLNDCWGQWPRDRIAARIEVPTEVPTELRAKVRAKIRALYWIASCLIAFTALAPGCVQATEGTDQTPPKSKAINLVSAEEIERSAQAQYQQLLQQAAAKDA
ncbi:MAG: hypothetical protein EBQ78_13595, partial [Betaproteobacteria bacterium]|nr:hypothetical protein [Betaproteobacteria bacterium]